MADVHLFFSPGYYGEHAYLHSPRWRGRGSGIYGLCGVLLSHSKIGGYAIVDPVTYGLGASKNYRTHRYNIRTKIRLTHITCGKCLANFERFFK